MQWRGTKNFLPVAALVCGAAAGIAWGVRRRRAPFSFCNRVVLITGGSRGLGLVLARQLAVEGARLALVARNVAELEQAGEQLAALGAKVLTLPCDVRRQDEVNEAVARAVTEFGRLDVLINNAGIIQVGPFEEMRLADFEDAMAVHFYAPLFFTLATLPHFRAGGGGRIVNISSIGGKIAVPHLLPYTASKFALVGLSDGLRAELRRQHVFVTTICPGLMRTGSPRNALFKGRHRREYAWFSISDSLPLLSMSAERAANKIIEACRRGRARVILGAHVKTAVVLNEVAPGLMGRILALANSLLPSASNGNSQVKMGYESESRLSPSWLTQLNEQAARQNNELGAAI